MNNIKNKLQDTNQEQITIDRKIRYETTTKNKVCTVRAPENRHRAIKKYAKDGCSACVNLQNLNRDLKEKLANKSKITNWNDDFTQRDLTLCAISMVITFLLVMCLK